MLCMKHAHSVFHFLNILHCWSESLIHNVCWNLPRTIIRIWPKKGKCISVSFFPNRQSLSQECVRSDQKKLPTYQASIRNTLLNDVVSAHCLSLPVICEVESTSAFQHYYSIRGLFLKNNLKNAYLACLASACFLPTLIMPCCMYDYA